MRQILTFDIGTTAVKTCVFNGNLQILGYSNEEYVLETAAGGIVELEPDVYVEAVLRGAKAAFTKACAKPEDTLAIAITTQGETLIPIDEQGNALCKSIVWLDERAHEEAAQIAAHFGAEHFYAHTGISECNGYVPIAKLLWLKRHHPALYENTHRFLLLEDYIIFRLTGAFVSEKSLLSTTGWFDIVRDEYWDDMLAFTGIDRRKLPAALNCGEIVAQPLLPDVAAALELTPDTLVVTTAMDQITAAIGAGNFIPGMITETTGTGMCIGATVDKPDFSDPLRVNLYRHVQKGSYFMVPVCMTAGMVLKWFKDEFCAEECAKADMSGGSVYDVISEVVEGVPPLSNGLLLVPYLTGTLQPDNNPGARGVFYGIGLDTKRPHFLRAIYEAIAFMLRENVELIERVQGRRAVEIRSLGGGAKSRVWRQIKADVSALSIVSMQEAECTSLGAAILAALALGWYPSLQEAAATGNRVAERLEPNATLSEAYNGAYHRYHALYEATKSLR